MSKPGASHVKHTLKHLVGWLLGGHLLSAQAAIDCIVPDAMTASATALKTLKNIEPQCHKNAPFLYALGRMLNQLGHYDEAIDPLEGVLLYQPEHWPGQLEYAIALEGTGDHTSALALLQNLLQNHAVDGATKQQITSLVQRQASTSLPHNDASYSLAAGYDDNLLGSTHHTHLELTTPVGLLPVELNADQTAHPGSFVRTEVRYTGLLPLSTATTHWRYSLEGSYRVSPNYSPANQNQLGVMLERNTPDKLGPYLFVQHQTLQRTGNTVMRQTQLGFGYDLYIGPGAMCQQRLGLDTLHLNFPASSILNGNYTGILSQTNCPNWGLQAQLRTGQDQPIDASRPGGAQQQYNLRVSKQKQFNAAILAFEWETSHQQDQSGYSPLLSNNAPRQISRQAYRLEYRWKAAAGSPFISFERLDQTANIALFETKNQILTLGYRARW